MREWLTFIHKDQSELVLGAAVSQLCRVRALILLRELIKQYLHQTFGLVKVDLAVLQKSKQMLPHIQHTHQIPDGRWTCCLQLPYRWLLVQREYIMKQSHKSIWNAMCTLKMKYFFFFFPITHANTQTNSDTEKTAFELIFTAFMLIKISVCLACW